MEPTIATPPSITISDDSGYTVISTVVGKSVAAQNALQAVYSFHNWLAQLKGGDPGDGKWVTKDTVNWWDASKKLLQEGKIPSFKCHRSQGMHWYRTPDPKSIWFNISEPGDNGIMDVWKVVADANQDDWFLVLRSLRGDNDIWVKASETGQ